MTHCRHWQRAHSSGPSLLSGFAVSAHRAVGQRGGEKQERNKGSRGINNGWNLSTPDLLPKRKDHAIKSKNDLGEQKVANFKDHWEMDVLFNSNQPDISVIVCYDSTGVERIALSIVPWEVTDMRWKAETPPTCMLALWLGIPEDKEINTAMKSKKTINQIGNLSCRLYGSLSNTLGQIGFTEW